METPQHRKLYSDDFKRKAVGHHVEHGGTLSESAKSFGVTASMLHKWLKSCPAEPVLESFSSSGGSAEVQQLRREILAMKEDIGELKRIVGKAFLTRFMDELEEESKA